MVRRSWNCLGGLSFNELNDFDVKLQFAEELISLSRQKGNLRYQHSGYFQKGNALQLVGNLEEAIDAYFKSAEVAIQENSFSRQGNAYGAIADIYSISNNNKNAIHYYDKAIALLRNSNDTIGLAAFILNAGEHFLSIEDNDSALSYFIEAGNIFEELGYTIGQAYSLGNIGVVYAQIGNKSSAEKNINKAITILEEYGDYYPISVYLVSLSDIYLEKGDQLTALNYLKKSLRLAEQYGLKEQISDSSFKLSEFYEKMGNWEESLKLYKTYLAYRDSVKNIKSIQAIADLRTEYEVSQKQIEVDLLKQQKKNQQIIVLSSLVAVVLICLLFFFSYKRNKLIQQNALKEKELAQERLINKRLQQVDKLKDQFLANTSHELRTPLQGIIGLSETLYEQEEQPEKQENLGMIISSGKRLNSLVNDILDFSRLKNYDIELIRKPINLRVLTDIVLRNNAPLIKGKDLQLLNEIPEDLPAAHGDENRLQQVLYNLIGNAIKFTESGYVKVEATAELTIDDLGLTTMEEKIARRQSEMVISIQDTGTGIPKNKLEAIFQEFEQADGSISREFTGTGLGLSISKRLVELHGGQMWVESVEGKGSTFYFSLPVSTKEATTLPARQEARMAASPLAMEPSPAITTAVSSIGSEDVHILVVDDEPINQQVLKNYLAGRNFQLTQAMNGQEAFQAIETNPDFDLVLLDVMMPHMSGYEVCERIREIYLPSELPIIMITAKNQLQDIVQGLSIGANDYLPKPFHKEELLARIKTQVDLHNIFDVTGRFVPNQFLHSLNRERITEVMLGDHIEKEVAVLFTDIRDYTSLAETMTPEQNFRFVNAFHGRMGPVIRRNQGFINQYLGDAIMAIFPAGPETALQAAIDMQQCLQEYNEVRISDGRKSIRMGIGLHTGLLIMGIIGDQDRLDAATIADTVNTASRIENLNKHYGTSILLSEDSWRQIQPKDQFHFRYLGKVQVKGKKEPVGLYECFDGDDPAIAKQKANTQLDFVKGLELFLQQDFGGATEIFSRIIKMDKEDQPAHFFLARATDYLSKGIPEKWTGVEVMSYK